MDKVLIFAVLKQWLLQQRETEATFVYIIFAVLLLKIVINGFWNAVCCYFEFSDIWDFNVPSMLWRCWLGGRKGIQPVKNWVVRCWHGYLSGARCRLAYATETDATATYCLSCFSKIQIGFTFLVPAHPGSPRKRAIKRVCVTVWMVKRSILHHHTKFREDRSIHCWDIAIFVILRWPLPPSLIFKNWKF